MKDKYFKYVQWLLYLLMGLSALFVVLFYISPANPDIMLYWMYTMCLISLVVILGVIVMAMVKSPKGSYKILIICGIMVALGILSYLVSKNTLNQAALEKYQITANTVKLVGAGLIMTYIIFVFSIGALIYTSVAKFFQK
jgi:hypothetical protein